MARGKKTKTARKLPAAHRARRAGARAGKTPRRAAKPSPPRAARRRPRAANRPPETHYSEAIRALQDAAASLADGDLIDIVSDLSWPTRAKWLSSYFADRLPEEVIADGDGLAASLDDIGAQVAVLLMAMDAERPADFLNAVTCCFSGEPSHVDAGLTWLEENTGARAIDLDALEGLPGYQVVADLIDRVRAG